MKKCKMIKSIVCDDYHMWSLEGCPDTLQDLYIRNGERIQSLKPLVICARISALVLQESLVTDLTPLIGCKRLKTLSISWSERIKDLSPLSECPDLEELDISSLRLIKDLSFFEQGFTKLRDLNISGLSVDDFSPLIKLRNLQELCCRWIPSSVVSFLPLAKCLKLKKIRCSMMRNANGLSELSMKRPDIEIK